MLSCNEKNIQKKPILWMERSSKDKGQALDVDIRGKRLYISDLDKLISFNISSPDAPIGKIELKRPQGVIDSYIHDKYLFEVTTSRKIRISKYNKPQKVISLIDKFTADTKLQFFNNYVFVGSGKHIIVIRIGEDIEIFKYNTFLFDVVDIGVIANILAVSIADNSFKIYDLKDLSEPILISGIDSAENMRYSHISTTDKFMFVVEEHTKPEKKYIVKQVDIKNLNKWREVLLSYDEITALYVKYDYLGILRDNIFLDVYKIKNNNRLDQILAVSGYEISDFDMYKNYIYIIEKKMNDYLRVYELEEASR